MYNIIKKFFSIVLFLELILENTRTERVNEKEIVIGTVISYIKLYLSEKKIINYRRDFLEWVEFTLKGR